IDNIPFYAPHACGDIVFAEYDPDEERLTYRETVSFSDNSTIQVILFDEFIDYHTVTDPLMLLGCEFEGVRKRYFVLNIPGHISYKPIREALTRLKDQGVLDYAEPVLSPKHR
ncbi:MAG: DUF4265 domain-containing protein, partial [Chitinophagaceae bacterium]